LKASKKKSKKEKEKKANKKPEKLIDKKGIRLDGRKLDELRPVKLEVGVLPNADGSAYLEQGKNKILVGVYGPKEAHPRHIAMQDRAVIQCRYHMAPFSVDERKSPAPSRRDVELSKVIREALEPAIFLEYYPKTAIQVYMVVACAAGKADGKLIVDLMDTEDKVGEADVPVAFMPNLNAITLLQMDGSLSVDEFEKTINMALDGCKQLYALQKEALKSKYVAVEEAEEE